MDGSELVREDSACVDAPSVGFSQSMQNLASTSQGKTLTLDSGGDHVWGNLTAENNSYCGIETSAANVDKMSKPPSHAPPGIPSINVNMAQIKDGHDSEVLKKQRHDESPDTKKSLKYQSPGKSDMRHQLLVQRTFSPHSEKFEPRTSSPMRKVRAFEATCGCSPIRSTPAPSSACKNTKSEDQSQQSTKAVPLISPNNESVVPNHDVMTIFKTPIRAQYPSSDTNGNNTPSRQSMSLFSSPAGSGSCLFTPGRHFVNPFEMDADRLNMPPFSPGIFNIGSACGSAQKNNAE
ncbi:hypothetical protein EGW08_009526, partial [Elysia chlorotica]